MKVQERLQFVRKKLNLTQQSLAISIGLNQANVRDLESGKVKFSTLHAIALEHIHQVNAQWLMTGQGEIFLENGQKSKKKEAPISKPPVGNAIRIYNNVLKRTGLELDAVGQEQLFKLIQDMLAEEAELEETEDNIVNSISITNHKVDGA